MLIQMLIACVLSLLSCGVLVRYSFRGAKAYPSNRPQRFHAGDVPRFGGLAMGVTFWSVGLAGAWLEVHAKDPVVMAQQWWLTFLAAMLPAWLIGLAEDYTHDTRPGIRLAATGLSAWLLAYCLELRIDRIGIPWLNDYWTSLSFPGFFLAVFAIASMGHAFNIIDGYNGLAGAVVIMITVALIYVAMKVGDWHWMSVLVTLLGVTIGFWFWNYPRGLLFAGDGGAYLWGMVVAVASIGLVQRNSMISPWFPVLLLAYPIIETIFSVYRKLIKGRSPGVADALHFHQLIYRRVVRGVFHDDYARQMLMRNNKTSPYLWGVAILAVIPAVIFWNNSLMLASLFVVFATGYVAAYLSIVRFKVPRWLRRRSQEKRG